MQDNLPAALVRERGKEESTEQFTVSVAERVLEGALFDEKIYMSIPSVCRALRIDHKPQVRRLKHSKALSGFLQQIVLRTKGGTQVTTCLALEGLTDWLTSIQQETVEQDCRERLLFFQHHLSAVILTMIPTPDHERKNSQPPRDPSKSLVIVEEQVVIAGEEHSLLPIGSPEAAEIGLDLLANLPKIRETTLVQSHLYEEDTAIRESYVAGLESWRTDEVDQPFYPASNQLEVYISPPGKPIELSVALQRIGQLNMRTVVTGRIIFWLWNLRRNDPTCSVDGWVALKVHEILQLRGITEHSRAIAPGSSNRVSDGYYEEKYKEDVYQDLQALHDTHIRRYIRVVEDGQERTFYSQLPYLRVNLMKEQLPGKDRIVGIAVKPGEWMPLELREAFYLFAAIDRRIFKLKNKTDRHGILLALYLAERWRYQAQQSLGREQRDLWAPYRVPIRMRDLLMASMISIDWDQIARFARRIENALSKLYKNMILGAPPKCLTAIDKERDWGTSWIESYWELLPSFEAESETSSETMYQFTLTGESVETKQLPAPKRSRRRKNT